MNYHSVAEIYEAIDATRERLYREAEALTPAQASFRAAPGAWSAAEIVEHLSLIDRQMLQLFGSLLRKAEATAPRAPEQPFATVSIAEVVAAAAGRKFEAPETARPGGALSIAEGLARLRETRAALHDLRPRFEQVDGTAVEFPHSSLGPLNLYQWLAFVGMHERRHLRQLEALTRAPDFPVGTE